MGSNIKPIKEKEIIKKLIDYHEEIEIYKSELKELQKGIQQNVKRFMEDQLQVNTFEGKYAIAEITVKDDSTLDSKHNIMLIAQNHLLNVLDIRGNMECLAKILDDDNIIKQYREYKKGDSIEKTKEKIVEYLIKNKVYKGLKINENKIKEIAGNEKNYTFEQREVAKQLINEINNKKECFKISRKEM